MLRFSMRNSGWLALLAAAFMVVAPSVLRAAKPRAAKAAANNADDAQPKAETPEAASEKSADKSADQPQADAADEEDKPVRKTDQEWKRLLTPSQYRVTRQKQTEMPFRGKYVHTKKEGAYRCVCCGAKLFGSDKKFESGTGWPSFYAPVSEKAVAMANDFSDGSLRVEVTCARCDAHLGHVFNDGPEPTGLRYCINSVSLKLEEAPPKAATPKKTRVRR